MYLKEAFRYQNFLQSRIDDVLTQLGNTFNVTKTTEEHMRSKSNPEAQDEKVEVTKFKTTEHSANDLVNLLTNLMDEKTPLSKAINVAKVNCGIDIDSELELNKLRHRVVDSLTRLDAHRSKEAVTSAVGYKFNAEGNQVQYRYDVKQVTTIDFDRTKVKALARSIIQKADLISIAVDKVMVEAEVDYQPKYDVNDSLDDVMDKFLTNRG